MKAITIVDGRTSYPYTSKTLDDPDCQMGATQMVTLVLAEELAKRYTVHFLQLKRSRREEVNGVSYRGLQDVADVDPDVVILMRRLQDLPAVMNQWPLAGIVCWMHDLHPEGLAQYRELVLDADATLVCGSQFHAQHIRKLLLAGIEQEHLPTIDIRQIYLPLKNISKKEGVSIDKNQLVYASSPHKGLPEVLKRFEEIKREIPDLHLEVFNPGYFHVDLPEVSGVTFMGRRPNEEVLEALQGALCLFHPQTAEPETFGMVFAEAHAVGTPVLAHPFGSAPELLSSEELVEGTDLIAQIETLRRWQTGERPQVSADLRLEKKKVLLQWEETLALKSRSAL